jgi:hypothetical protein
MLYELRVYEPCDGKADAMQQRFHDHARRFFLTHGIDVVGVFTPQPSDGRIGYMTRFTDESARTTAWAAFGADPDWQTVKTASEADGPLMKQQTVTILDALPAGLLLG